MTPPRTDNPALQAAQKPALANPLLTLANPASVMRKPVPRASLT
jgi:hypothetical protein